MSLQKKITNIVTQAVKEAVMVERGRCLWVLSKLEEETDAALRKVLMIESQRHTIEVKRRIMASIFAQVRRGIASGARAEPPRPADKPNGKVPDTLPEDL